MTIALVVGTLLSFAFTPAQAYPVVVDGIEYESRAAYYASDYFRENGKRCGLVISESGDLRSSPSDCTMSNTTIAPEYDPGQMIYFQVVVHVLRDSNGFGDVSDALIQSQIDILNEDFQAIPGTNGSQGTFAGIHFELATEDTAGQPTTGITRHNNTTWHNDGGSYWAFLAWDPHRYINIYLNDAGGALGYVPWLPQGGAPGAKSDRIVCLWDAFGRNSPGGSPYNQGRTATHEVGHYLGLHHVSTDPAHRRRCARPRAT